MCIFFCNCSNCGHACKKDQEAGKETHAKVSKQQGKQTNFQCQFVVGIYDSHCFVRQIWLTISLNMAGYLRPTNWPRDQVSLSRLCVSVVAVYICLYCIYFPELFFCVSARLSDPALALGLVIVPNGHKRLIGSLATLLQQIMLAFQRHLDGCFFYLGAT